MSFRIARRRSGTRHRDALAREWPRISLAAAQPHDPHVDGPTRGATGRGCAAEDRGTTDTSFAASRNSAFIAGRDGVLQVWRGTAYGAMIVLRRCCGQGSGCPLRLRTPAASPSNMRGSGRRWSACCWPPVASLLRALPGATPCKGSRRCSASRRSPRQRRSATTSMALKQPLRWLLDEPGRGVDIGLEALQIELLRSCAGRRRWPNCAGSMAAGGNAWPCRGWGWTWSTAGATGRTSRSSRRRDATALQLARWSSCADPNLTYRWFLPRGPAGRAVG